MDIGVLKGTELQAKWFAGISRAFLAKVAAAGSVLILSLVVMPLYQGGDQSIYRQVYDTLPDLDIEEAFSYYTLTLSSQEYGHFLLTWVASRFIDKDWLFSACNAFLAYVTMSLLLKWRTSIAVAFLLLLTNFYFLVLYFAAERLKIGFIFMVLSIRYSADVKRFISFAILAILSHVSLVIFYASLLLNGAVTRVLGALRGGGVAKAIRWALVLVLLAVFMPGLVEEQIVSKFQSYYGERGLGELGRVFVFLILALLYSKEKRETIVLFVPIVIAVFLVGGDRINMLGYLIFLYYGLQVRGGLNAGVLATSAYFAYQSIDFLTQIVLFGQGFVN